MLQPDPHDLDLWVTAYSAAGWSTFPLTPGWKDPLRGSRGFHDATSDGAWYRAGTRQNIGIACGPSGLVVLDTDCHHDLPQRWQDLGCQTGEDVLRLLAGRIGVDIDAEDDETLTCATWSGGRHRYWRARPDRPLPRLIGRVDSEGTVTSGLGPSIDVCGDGGYVVAAPSHVVGRGGDIAEGRYTPLGRTEDVECADGRVLTAPVALLDGPLPLVPEWLYRLRDDAQRERDRAADAAAAAARARAAAFRSRPRTDRDDGMGGVRHRVEAILRAMSSAAPGGRNDSLLRLTIAMRSVALDTTTVDERDLLDRLAAAAELSGLSRTEVASTIASATRYPVSPRRTR